MNDTATLPEAPPTFTAEQIPDLVQSEDFRAYKPEDRAWAVEQMLSTAYDHEASLGPWTPDRRKAWSQFAQEQHAAAGQSTGETAMDWATKAVTVPLHMVGGLAQQAVAGTAAGLDYLGNKIGLTDGSAAEQFGQAMDANTASWLASGKEGAAKAVGANHVREGLDALRQKIDAGDVPADVDTLHAWMQQQDAELRPKRAAWYAAADSIGTQRQEPNLAEDARAWANGLDDPENAQLLVSYLRTHSPQSWEALVRRMETPPARAAAEERMQTAQAGPLGTAMQRMGMDAQNLTAAADPVNLALLMAGGAGAKGALEAGTWKGIGRQMLRTAPEMAAFGAGFALRDNPQASGGDVLRSAAEMALGGAGFAGLTGALGKGYQRLKSGPQPVREPVVTNEPNPFEGPIEAPPQPREDGGVVTSEATTAPDGTPAPPTSRGPSVPPEGSPPEFVPNDNPSGTVPPVAETAKPEVFDPVENPGPDHLPPDQRAVFEIEQKPYQGVDIEGVGSNFDPNQGKRTWQPEAIPNNPMGRGSMDILDFLNENPLQKAGTSKEGGFDRLRSEDVPRYWGKFIFAKNGKGYAPDEAAMEAYRQGVLKTGSTPDHLADAVHDAIKARQSYRASIVKGKLMEREQINQHKRFEKAKTSGEQPIEAAALEVGDKLIIDDHPVEVTRVDFDEDGYTTVVQVKDGPTYGVQHLSPQEVLLVDEFKPRQRSTSTDFLPEEQAPSGALFDMTATESTRPRNRGETTKPQASDPLAELGTATRAGEAERAQSRMALDESLALPGRGAVTRGPLPSLHAVPPPSTTARTWSGEVQTLHGIRKFLLDAVGLPAVGVGRFKAALGIYRVKPETVRLQAINDIPVLSHEIGHAIHFRELNSGNRAVAPDWGGVHDAELMPLGRATSRPTYTPEQVRKEGVAEFTRLWLTDPAKARAEAPAFSAFWETELNQRNPRLAEGLREAQRRIQDYIAMPAFEKAKAQIVFDPAAERTAPTVGDWMRRIYTSWVDTLQPAKRVLKQAGEMEPKLASEAARVEAWMENHRGGWASKANSDVFGRQTDLDGGVIGEGMQTILKDLQPGDSEAFSAYLALKRAAEIEASGRRSGFEQGKLPPAEMRALEKRFEKTRQKLLKWSDNSLQLLVDSGLLDSDAAAKMRAAGRDYVPFYRLYEKLNGVSFGPEQSANGGGFVDLNSGIKRLKGSDRAIIDPLQSLMKNAFMFRKLAEQNHIGVQFFDLMRKLQGHGKFAEGIAPKMTARKVSHEAIVQKLIDEGVVKDAKDLPADADLTLTLWEAMKKPDTKTGEVIVFKKGERQHWEVKDPQLMKALKTADANAVKLASFLGPEVTKLLTLPARTLRFGATGGPWFALPNFIRDQFTAGIQSKAGYVPFWDGFKGALEVMRGTDTYQRWREMGGEFSGVTTHTQAFRTMLEDVLPKDPTARSMITAMASPKHWQRALGAAGRLLEEATRVGEFARGVKNGMTEMEAANASKSVSLNFARSGEVSRTINMLSAFFNAKVQEMDMILQNHRTRPAETIMKGMMYITVPSVAVWMLGKDDKKIQDLPEWRKNLFWNVNLDGMARALGYKEGFILSVPKPFLMGQIYGTTVERALDHATGRDPNGWRKAVKGLASAPADIAETPFNIAGLKPLIEVATNYNFYRDSSIVPDRMKHLPKEQQYDSFTSETAKMAGKALGLSPMMIDHTLRGYFATAGKFGTDAIDWGMAKLGLAEVPPAPEKGIMEMPVLNRFAGSPYAANAFVERFYKAADEMEGLLGTFSKQTDQMTETDQQKWWQKNGPDVQWFQRTTDPTTRRTAAGDVSKAQRSLSEIGKAMKDVQASQKMTPADKRTRLMELSKQRNTTAERAFKTLFPQSVKQRHY